MAQIQPPETFDFSTPNEWPKWKKRFERYLVVSGMKKKEEADKIDLFMYLMGDRADDIFRTFKFEKEEEATKIDSVLKAFDSHFCVRKNIIYERAKFNSRIQEDREPVDEFITSLYKLADSCEFEGLHEQLIRDRIVVGVRDKALSERMQLDSELTLEKAVKMVRQQEAVRQQQVDLQRPSTSQKVNQVKFNSKKQSPKQQQQPSRKKEKSARTRSRCPKCGGFTHREGQACRAEGQKCNLCSKTGHFANCCPDKQAKTAEVKAVSELDEEIGFLLEVSAVEDSSNLDNDEDECRRRWTAEIQVNGKKVKFKLDSQADVTCVPLCLFKKIMGQQRLVESDINIRAAEFSELQTVGMFISTLRNGNYEIKEKIYVIRRLSEPLLSRRACELLNLARRIEVVATRINPIKEFPEVFEGLGQIGNPYEIKLKPGAKPYAVHTPRRVPIPLMEKLRTRLEELEKAGIIAQVNVATEWCAPTVIAGKPNGDIRLCVDLSRLNEHVQREVHPMPVVEHMLGQLGEARFFSKLDANSGFHQIPLSTDCQHLTTFITPFGRYKYCRMPFGISLAPEYFQRIMSIILQGMDGVMCYLDDILIFASDSKTHDRILRLVLRKLKEAKVTLNKAKCVFGVPRINFLGHILDEDGIRPDPAKIEAVARMPAPTDVHGVRRFLGMVNHLGRFVENLSEIVAPLNQLLVKGQDFVWDCSQERAFRKLKELLTTQPILAAYDVRKPTMVSSDASSYGLGAVLKQEEDDAKNLDKVIEAFDNHFIGKRNVVYERALFGLRSQRPEETIEEFVTVLHRISEHCEYANLREELIRDRLVLGVKDRKLSEKLMLNENLTLAKAVEIARQWEAVMREQQDLNTSISQVDTTRKVAKQKPKASGHGKDNGRSTFRQTDSAKETDEGKKFPTCFNCGTTKHHYRYRDKCPAKDKVFGKCGKKGHYTNLCRRKNNEVNAISSEETPAWEKVSYVYAVREPTLGSRKSRWKSTVRVNGTAIHFKLDPGSDVTLIPFSLYKRYFSNVQLTPTDGQLMAAANQRLENAGTFVAKLRANTREMKETVYVVHHLEQPLLGVGACEDLQLVKRIDLVINGTTDVNPEREFPKLFEGLGLLEQPYHIKLKEGAKPFSIPVPRRVPLPLMPKLKEQLDAMVAQEVIEPVDEPTEWCAPIVLAGKPNGKIRICVDLSRLNLSVERELHPLPVLEHELAQLNGAKIFSRLDANSGFWQIKLSEESQTLTTFIAPFGRYKFKRLPFGISSAPEHFQKRMSAILRGVNGVICHMDDILIFAKRKEEHDETLREVLRRLKNSGITLNKEKCQFGVSNVTFLGHYIDEHGIKADEKKVKAIAEMKPPTDVHGVQRFMGMVNFLGRFVPNLAEITKPLNDLRKKDVSFIWGSPQKKAFEKVKDVLASDRVLASFDISKKTMVSADAVWLGAVLKQEHEANEWRPVTFSSRTLTKTEQGYAQIEKEALAITWACERFKDFVVGKTFLIETDHKHLVPIFTTKDLNDLTPRLQPYRMRMLQFSFHIFHTPGKDLITADALSRQPLPGHLPEDEELQEEVENFVRSIVLHQSTTDDRLAKIALIQKLEPTLQNVAFYSKNGWPAKCQLSPLERSFYDVRDEIGEENGLLMRGLRVIIPSNMRKDVLNRIHAGHQGITKCRARAKDHVWWPGIGQEIQDMVKTCEKCIENQPLKHEPLIPNDFPERPWQKVGMDLFHYEGREKVWVKDLRAWGSVIEKASAPRSYIVETPVGTYRRNSLLLASSQQQVDPSETSPDSQLPAETEETPGNELPAEELQQLPAIAPEMKQLSPSPGKVSRYGRRYKRVQR
ncbi:K02A2.6-like [Cordylochernes scorpioides]|uniref:RNA-directed DNA polymerase n=1 Tax=Cordylochernes scorpioides TaxID=51811 RepID=A0ABY6KDL9_9ARAC|nr:K02A2.6-like [Cordylochernes scorpioides]